MSKTIQELKIIGWEYKGFKTPDVFVNIEDPENKRNFTLYQMLSGEGKTTTLNLLRNSFYDINKKLNKSEIKNYINEVKSDNPEINEGLFEVRFKLNNEINYRVNVEFDYINDEINYSTFKGDGSGFEVGLLLPDSINEFITPEFLNITFFDLELTESLYEADKQQTNRIIKKLCKLDYLDQISNSLESFIKEFRKKNQGKLKDNELEKSEINLEKIKKHYQEVSKKAEKQKEKKSNLIKKIDDIEKKLEAITNEKSDIKNKINSAKENLDNKNETLREAFELAYSGLKNPMCLNKNLKDELELFENNLTKKRIPKGVGEAFFDEIIDSDECLCGNHMTPQMQENIKNSKKLFLDEENIAIVNPIKTAIKNFENIENIDDVYQNLIKYEREAKIAKNEFDQVYENTDDDVLKKLASDKAKSTLELDEIEHWLKNIYNKPHNPQDPPNTESIRTLDKKISDLEEDINKRSKAVTESKKINKLKEWLNEIQKDSLDKISKKIIEDINKEVKRVLPLEEIYVESIKNKITLITPEGNKRSGASRGQMARIAYLFLINLLNKSNLKFPLIVDSPVTALDAIGRSEIAKGLIKDHSGQYIGFIFDVEKEQFAEILQRELANNINLITVFNKSEASKHMIALAEEHRIDINEFETGVVAYDHNFFNKFTGVTK